MVFLQFIIVKYTVLFMNKVDILAVGAHPDDVELGCGGTIIKHVYKGYRVAIVDLTRGELGTRGNADVRIQEAAAAAKILGVSIRENLGLEDGFFRVDTDSILRLVRIIRHYQPDVVLTNAPADRHPDHGRAAQLTREACFLAGLPKIITKLNETQQSAWRPGALYYYIQAQYHSPHFVVDISGFMEQKMQAIKAYASQFYRPDAQEPETFISRPEFLELIYARAVSMGILVGFTYAEGFLAERYMGVDDLMVLK